jgi:protoheme IX farnesyltransferase
MLSSREQSVTDETTDEGRPPSPLYAAFAWFVLYYNLFVILVGTVVRATRSGDGCGSHWPLCDGEVIPTDPSVARIIEWTHRLVSGVDGVLVLALVVGGIWLFRRHRRHPIKGALLATLALTGIEAWIGRHLVVQGLVAGNASPERAVWMALHLTNTFLLLTALTLSAWWASGRERLRLAGQGAVSVGLALSFLAMIVLGASGAVTALGDTLFPVRDHADAVAQSLSPGAHFLQKMRILHPYIAGSVGLYLLLIAGLTAHLRPSPLTRRYAYAVGYLFLFQCALGGLNVFLKAPVWMQVVHLLVADVVWIYAVLLAAAALGKSVPQVELAPVFGMPDEEARAALGRPTWKDYVALTKPRVISLLLFTTLTASVMAAGGWPGTGLFLAVALGGYMAAGAANAINMVIDRDIDGRMKRTATRPTVTQRIPSRHALLFGLALACGSFALLFAAANLLTAMLSLAGLVFYVLVYTLLLKRRTWHNIVIGGAAGAFPPLVGWAAVTGSLSPLAWYLFAIVFLWTPAHFWALALLIKDDYKDAGVPMLPVVMGERATVLQIALYAVLTAVVSMLPLAQGLVGPYYVATALVLNLVLLARSAQLFVRTERPQALSMYKYSMLYLFLLFLALAVDSASAWAYGLGGAVAMVVLVGLLGRLRRGPAAPAATAG